ncbi:NAD(+)/NADH kinase [Candidatus Woesearchaeota archaeon]|nr:NAD(+)/NADH kinase [Candidatus Woesearchaeota archaeon]
MGLDRIVVVRRNTPLEELLRRHATASQVKFYLESRGESYSGYREAHDAYHRGVAMTASAIPSSMRSQVIEKGFLPTHMFAEKDLIVVVGDPGLFVNVAKYAQGQPIIVVNPDAERFDDTFTTCRPETFRKCLEDTLGGKTGLEEITMAEAVMEDGQSMLALNDLYIGRSSHVSAKYRIEHGKKSEMQSSDGILVSTGAGSTGWLTSIMVGAYALAGNQSCPLEQVAFPRDSDYLVFTVMNPFPSRITGTGIIRGRAAGNNPLKVVSQMPESGVIFSDGIESDYLEFTAGKTATIMPAYQKAHLVRWQAR